MAVTKLNSSPQLGMASVQLDGVTVTTGGGIVALPNPEGEKILILRTYLHVRTKSTGAANISAGIAANNTTSATDIINALAVGGAIDGKTYNGNALVVAAKTELTSPAVWDDGEYLTITGSADTTGLDAVLYIEYVRIGSRED